MNTTLRRPNVLIRTHSSYSLTITAIHQAHLEHKYFKQEGNKFFI